MGPWMRSGILVRYLPSFLTSKFKCRMSSNTKLTETGSRANFAIASSFLMQLLVTSESESEQNEINDLVGRWRWAMRVGSGNAGSGLMSLGLLRLDGLLLENGTVQPAT